MKNYTFLFAVLLSNLLFAQGDWVKMMQDPNVNFYDVQKAFYQQHKEEKEANLKEEDESEYRFFKRLEYELLPRVFPTGKLPSPDLAWKEIQKYRQQHPIPSANHAKNITSPTWTSLGPDSLSGGSWSPGLGRVNVVMVDPIDSNKIYIGAPSGGLWKSADGGHTWATTTDNLPVLGVSTIAIDPTNTNVIYIGTSDNDAWECFSIGILKSTDGGNTWNTTGMSYTVNQGAKIYSLLIDPTNHNTLLAATTSGVFKTTDGAATWTQVSTITNIRDLQFKPGNHNVVYAVNNDFYRSINNGNSFTQITSGLPADTLVNRLKIGVTAANPNAVYVIAGQNGGNGYFGLYYSNDGGLNFSTRSNSPNILGYAYDGSSGGGQDWYTLALAVSPTDENEVFAGGVNIWKSNDGGVNWSLNAFWEPAPFCPIPAGYVHADIHTLVFFNHTLFSGCDGGIWKSPDNGNTWNNISNGLCITEFYRLGGTPYYPNVIYAGAQDNGIIKYNA
ncbi:MAG: glycosyl hydrolase, partial [Bacteroidota bacterium]